MSDDLAGIRPARDEDVPRLLELFALCFGRPMSTEHWHWKYRTRETSAETVWVGVDTHDRPVFQYGGMPFSLRIGDRTVDAMSGADVMTDPAFRRRGVFAAVMAQAHAAWRDAGVTCVTGLPTAQWGSRTRVLDWRPVGPLAWRLRVLRPEAILARRLRWSTVGRLRGAGRVFDRLSAIPAPPPRGITVVPVTQLEETFELAPGAIEREPILAPVRDRDWVSWRYLTCPEPAYRVLAAREGDQLAGYVALREDPRFVFVTELTALHGKAARALLCATLAWARGRDAVAVAFLGTTDAAIRRALRRTGFVVPWGRPYTFRCVPLADDPPWSILGDRRRWRISGGDFDVL